MNTEVQQIGGYEQRVMAAVLEASVAWVRSFNDGNTDACVAAYTPGAVMEAKPMGRFEGRQAIDDFWRPFMASGATDLVYRDVKLHVVDAKTVELSASWSMNVGYGIITCERWVEEADGAWRLLFDAFEIQEQYGATKP